MWRSRCWLPWAASWRIYDELDASEFVGFYEPNEPTAQKYWMHTLVGGFQVWKNWENV